MYESHPHFVPTNRENRRETATLLVGTAEENDIDQHDIRSTSGGYYITDALAEALGMDTSEDEALDTSDVDTDDTTQHPGSPVPDGVSAKDVQPPNQDALDSAQDGESEKPQEEQSSKSSRRKKS